MHVEVIPELKQTSFRAEKKKGKHLESKAVSSTLRTVHS